MSEVRRSTDLFSANFTVDAIDKDVRPFDNVSCIFVTAKTTLCLVWRGFNVAGRIVSRSA
jgi:hypothetical protein